VLFHNADEFRADEEDSFGGLADVVDFAEDEEGLALVAGKLDDELFAGREGEGLQEAHAGEGDVAGECGVGLASVVALEGPECDDGFDFKPRGTAFFGISTGTRDCL